MKLTLTTAVVLASLLFGCARMAADQETREQARKANAPAQSSGSY